MQMAIVYDDVLTSCMILDPQLDRIADAERHGVRVDSYVVAISAKCDPGSRDELNPFVVLEDCHRDCVVKSSLD